MPGTARSLGVRNSYDVVENIRGSVAYLREHLSNYASPGMSTESLTINQIRLTMAAYNAGPNAVKKYGGVPPYRETQAYVNKVVRLFNQLSSGM